MDIEINNFPDHTFSDTCQIIGSVHSTLSSTSTGKYYSPDNTFSDEVVSASITKSFLKIPYIH